MPTDEQHGRCDHDHAHDHHGQNHDADHAHGHGPASGAHGKLRLAVFLTLAFVVGEAIAGYFAHSLALLSDAGHNFADAAALGFSWYAVWIARKPSNHGMTYGYHRVGILAALVNAVSLVVIALLIFWEAAERLRQPEAVHGWLMVVVAAVAIAVNVTISMWLHSGAKHDINVRSAYLHMIGDAVSAFGVVIAGIVVLATGAHIADPIVSFLIAALILWSSWGILKESVNVLLEGTPAGIDMAAVVSTIRSVPGVLGAHDLHVWTVGPGAVACSVHILVAEQTVREGQQILKAVVDSLEHRHGINHTTVQVEVEGHASNEMYCTLQASEAATHIGHHH
jgi:cobalt-zinc-cadmium efflux system protein